MEIEKYKAAWQDHTFENSVLSARHTPSPSVLLLRASVVRDRQRSEALGRLVFCVLFSLLITGLAFVLGPPGLVRVAALLFAAALVLDGIIAAIILPARLRPAATGTMLEFVRKQREGFDKRQKFERYSLRLEFALCALSILLLLVHERPQTLRESAFDTLGTLVTMTSVLAVTWWRAKARSKELSIQLDRYLRDLAE